MAVAATALRHGGHPVATLSGFLEKYATSGGLFPSHWTKTPKATPCFSAVYRKAGLFKSGMPKAGALTRVCLILLKAGSYSFSHIMGSVSGPLVSLCKGLLNSPKLGIRILPNPAMPKKERSCCLVPGGVNLVMALILSCDNCLDPGVKTYPK